MAVQSLSSLHPVRERRLLAYFPYSTPQSELRPDRNCSGALVRQDHMKIEYRSGRKSLSAPALRNSKPLIALNAILA
jgi:hypothetical protein